MALNRARCRFIASLGSFVHRTFVLRTFTWCIYTFPVAFIVRKQQFPTRPDMDAMPDIIVIFAISPFPFFKWFITSFIRPDISCRLSFGHLFISLAGCYPAFSSSCSRDFSSALSSVRTSPRIAHVPLYVRAYPPISSGSVAQSVPRGTFGNNTRLFSIALIVFLWALSVLLSLFINYQLLFILVRISFALRTYT